MSREFWPKGAAQRALFQRLRVCLPNEAAAEHAVRAALRGARLEQLPDDSRRLMEFARAYLAPELTVRIGPNLVLALLGDLDAMLELGDEHADLSTIRARPTSPNVRRASASVVRTESSKVPAVRHDEPAKAPPSAIDPKRATVLLVTRDRFARATLARAVMNAGYDARAVDSASEIAGALDEAEPGIVALVDTDAGESAAVLSALGRYGPALTVVAWTDAPPADTRSLLASCGVGRFSVLSKASSSAAVVDAVRGAISAAGAPVDVMGERDRDGTRGT